MAASAGSRIVEERTPEGLVITVRPLGLRGNALVMFLLGVLISVPLTMYSVALYTGARNHPNRSAIACAVLLGVFGGPLPVCAFGASIQFARRRTVFVVRPDRLLIRWIGPLRRHEREWGRSDVRGVVVEQHKSVVDGKMLDQLRIYLATEDLVLLGGIARTDLERLKELLTSGLALDQPCPPASPLLAAFPRPAAAKLDLQELGDIVSFVTPAVGLRGVMGIILGTGVFYTAFVLTIGVAIATGLIRNKGEEAVDWSKMLTLLAYLALGVSWIVIGLHYARRRSALVLTPDSLAFRSVSPVWRRELMWDLADVSAVKVVRFCYKEIVSYQLVLHRKQGGEPVTLLDDREEQEMEWVAAILRSRLPVGAGGDEPATADGLSCRRLWQQEPDREERPNVEGASANYQQGDDDDQG